MIDECGFTGERRAVDGGNAGRIRAPVRSTRAAATRRDSDSYYHLEINHSSPIALPMPPTRGASLRPGPKPLNSDAEPRLDTRFITTARSRTDTTRSLAKEEGSQSIRAPRIIVHILRPVEASSPRATFDTTFSHWRS